MSLQCAVIRRAEFQRVQVPPGHCCSGRKHPRRFAEVTRQTEAPREKVPERGSASTQAVTRVNDAMRPRKV